MDRRASLAMTAGGSRSVYSFGRPKQEARDDETGMFVISDSLSSPTYTFKKRPHRLRKNQVLLREHAGRQRLGTVTWQHRHHRLHQDGTVVQLGRHLVHGRARHLTTGINGALDHL